MAVEVDIPVEINDYHEKIIGGFTGRQLVSGLAAIALGLSSYFVCANVLKMDISSAGYVVMLLTVLPLAIGFLRIDGRPFEIFLSLMLRHYLGQHRLKLVINIPTDRSDAHVFKQREKSGRSAQPKEAELFWIGKKDRARRRKKAAKALAAAKKEYRREKRRRKKANPAKRCS